MQQAREETEVSGSDDLSLSQTTCLYGKPKRGLNQIIRSTKRIQNVWTQALHRKINYVSLQQQTENVILKRYCA